MRPLVEPHIRELQAYVPGKTIRETQKEFGINDLVKLASNESAWGPSPLALEAARAACASAHLYPLEYTEEVKQRICEYLSEFGVDPHHVVLGNGSNELIVLLTRAFLGPDEILLHGWPSFVVYKQSAHAQGRREIGVPLTAQYGYDLPAMLDVVKRENVKLIFIANPNNPTGNWVPSAELNSFIDQLPKHVIVVMDEAYAEYVTEVDYASCIPWVLKRPRTVVLKTFSKIFGLAGMRIGYAIGDPEIVQILQCIRDPFNVNSIGQAAAIAALGDDAHRQQGLESNARELPRVRAALAEFGIETTQSAANFVLMHLREDMPSVNEVVQGLLQCGVIVRPLQPYNLPRSIRVTIGKPDENKRFLAALSKVLARLMNVMVKAKLLD